MFEGIVNSLTGQGVTKDALAEEKVLSECLAGLFVIILNRTYCYFFTIKSW